MLTKKQHALLLYIQDQLARGGVSPSFEEMKLALGLRSKSGIHRLITGLEERGFLRRLPNRARALEVVKLPDGSMPAASGPRVGRDGFKPTVIQGGLESNQAVPTLTIPLPLLGRIAAGTPIEAISHQGQTIDIPAAMLGGGEHYALEVAGDSMMEAGILDGDTVLIERRETAENGEIVVALVDGLEVTLKKFYKRGGNIALEPANAAYETRILTGDRVRVQGRLTGLIRRY
jgi:repressor LexA